VNPYVAVATLVFLTSTLFLLPLLPAFTELRRKSDALPLSVIQQHAGEIRYFADSFRTYLKTLEPTLRECGASGRNASGVMPDGTNYLVLGSGNEALTLPLQQQDQSCQVLIASATDLSLSGNSSFSKDIYSLGRLVGGDNNHYRALLAEQEAYLGKGSSVMRWVHAGGELSADSGCKLSVRVSSDSRIRLATGCSFLRLNAPRIELGSQDVENAGRSIPRTSEISPLGMPRRIVHDGDFEIRCGAAFCGDLVVRGKLRIGSGARVYGSVKSQKDMVLGSGVWVEGSLISAGKLLIGPACLIHGPVIAEREMRIQAGTQCGDARTPTTVSALRVEVAEGVMVFGSLWAREYGEVVASA
jgi:cytoskeletal protein CcmA (bactofilin family)